MSCMLCMYQYVCLSCMYEYDYHQLAKKWLNTCNLHALVMHRQTIEMHAGFRVYFFTQTYTWNPANSTNLQTRLQPFTVQWLNPSITVPNPTFHLWWKGHRCLNRHRLHVHVYKIFKFFTFLQDTMADLCSKQSCLKCSHRDMNASFIGYQWSTYTDVLDSSMNNLVVRFKGFACIELFCNDRTGLKPKVRNKVTSIHIRKISYPCVLHCSLIFAAPLHH